MIQSICHEITESKTTYSFISYKLSHQFRYQSMSSWGEAEDGDCSVNLGPLALAWDGHGMEGGSGNSPLQNSKLIAMEAIFSHKWSK